MKLKAVMGEREEELLLKLEDGRVLAEIGDRVYNLDVRETEADGYLFFLQFIKLRQRAVNKLADIFLRQII